MTRYWLIPPLLAAVTLGGVEMASSTGQGAERPAAEPCDGSPRDPVRVQIGTVEAKVQAGAQLPLPVRVKGVCGLAAFQFGVAYDRAVVRLQRVERTPFLAGSPAVSIDFIGISPELPEQKVLARRPAGSGGVDGIGTLARLVFYALQPGVSQIQLTALHLFDPQGAEIPSFAVPVRLTVIEVINPSKPFRPRRRTQPGSF